MRRKYPLWLLIGTIFTVLIIMVSFALGFSGYHMVQRTTRTATIQLAEQISKITKLSLMEIQRSAHLSIASHLGDKKTFSEHLNSWRLIAHDLNSFPFLNTIFIGYESGDFFSVTALRTKADSVQSYAPDNASFILHSFRNRGGKIKSRKSYYDKNLHFIGNDKSFRDPFDPRTRSWYANAMRKNGYFFSDLYFYYGTFNLGVTISRRSTDLKRVAGVDINLVSLSAMLDILSPTPNSRIAVITPGGSAIAYTSNLPHDANAFPFVLEKEKTPALLAALEKYKKGERGLIGNIKIKEKDWVFYVNDIDVFEKSGKHIILMAMPIDEIMRDSRELLNRTLLISFCILLISLPLIWYMAQRLVEPLRILAVQAEKIRNFYFENEAESELVASSVAEIHSLFHVILMLKDNVKRFLSINSAINNERDFDKLLDLILVELMEVANAEGGMISLLDEKGQYQPDAKFYSKNLVDNQKFLKEVSIEQLRDRMPSSSDILNKDLIQVTITREDPLIAIDSVASIFKDPDVQYLDIIHLPLSNNTGECLGVLTFIKRVDNLQSSFQENHVFFIKTLVDVASVALEDHRLLEAEHNLLIAMVRIIAGAIDAKSPYTGAHCQRVPVLFNMILEAANDAQEGALKDFSCTDDEKEEANFAAWLHDCGKVTTPEYIVDKATKLETIYDRIHEIRMRFEVLKRDAEIACLKDILNGAVPEERNRQAEEEMRALDEEFAFVAHCNSGSAFLDAAALERLQTIGKRIWMRTLDKRLGVSKDELTRMEDSDPLPAFEELLSDKAEHIIKRSPNSSVEEYRPLGIINEPPENLYNRGELYNLSIARGTLNFEERYKINDHVTQTIMMLNKLPLPKRMKNIPNLAGSHHETLDGKGYPHRFYRDAIDIKARMLAIADIFEALTASDRPYKSAKTLSEALKIMKWFRDNNHIDPDLYELFIKENIPQKYAKEYLSPDQYDL